MVAKKVTIKNITGLHLAPAGKFCDMAMLFQECHIMFKYGSYEANAKSMLSVLAAGVRCGDEIEITCSGIDEQKALAALVELVENEFETPKASNK